MSQDEQKKPTTSLSDYYNMLSGLDWTYEMSDDHQVWKRGSAAMGKVEDIARQSEEHKKLFDAYKAHAWSGWKSKPDGTPDYDAGREVPKPERPKENVMRTGESNGS